MSRSVRKYVMFSLEVSTSVSLSVSQSVSKYVIFSFDLIYRPLFKRFDESSDARNSSNSDTKSQVLKDRTYFKRKTRTSLIIMFSNNS